MSIIALLASLSLFALLATSRPVLSGSDLSDLYASTSAVQTAAQQASFQVRPCQDDLMLDTAKQQTEYLSDLDAEVTTAMPSFEIPSRVKHLFRASLEGTVVERVASDTDHELHGSQADHDKDEPSNIVSVVEEQHVTLADELSGTSPLVVLAFSCVAAYLALACIASTLYIIKLLRAEMLVSTTVWDFLLCFWSFQGLQDANATTKKHSLGTSSLLWEDVEQQSLVHVEEECAERQNLHAEDKALYFDTASDMSESEWGDDVDEKYQDALDMSSFPLAHDLELEHRAPYQPQVDDPALPFLKLHPLGQSTSDCSPRIPGPSPIGLDSPSLDLSSRGTGVDPTPLAQSLIHSPRHSASPEFDIALMMQLRPGVGICTGANSAWMVRFLMTIFGWFAVALSGSTR